MAFFKSIWKNNSKHKKLCEELALANSIRDFSDNSEDLLEDGNSSDAIGGGFDDAITYTVKYLGNTTIPTPRSDSSTSDAVKRVITTAKGCKKLQRVTLSISPKGIEILDQITGEAIQKVSIYNISYCSADASHDHVFAFAAITQSPEAEVKEMCFRKEVHEVDFEGPLVCYAFLCQKRKMAQTVTLTVARSFERAYQIWQNKQFHAERKRKELNKLNSNNRTHHSGNVVDSSSATGTTSSNTPQHHTRAPSESDCPSLLIDFNSDLTAEICAKDHRGLLQNTWVSFEDDQQPQEFFAVPNLNATGRSGPTGSGWSRTAICSN
ncbi:low density lipoprotein receptor adapter protein 1-like [Uranotaenia lowii]|uniref:low density lipoprotein receptor adapter protein 1-like n=1 Tax=Uranotaenia lowii TaxID=190385 RepID=UPI00247AB904|nr:low density lipoprotein receptor adapter protein 1-like [Uranotaenia lowii]XP_055599403.1 low density lipoprotein receptor adapter protein 1-like [Uranotaenia lowii]XP_055599404.1 low density lipoprotein receptor adapter protein 1-like [Uranotaenia lowii]